MNEKKWKSSLFGQKKNVLSLNMETEYKSLSITLIFQKSH